MEAAFQWIRTHNFQRICLQFAEDRFSESPLVFNAFKTEFPAKFLVIAGDAKGCCPQALAGLHVKSDCIIHFGNACLSSGWLPTFRVGRHSSGPSKWDWLEGMPPKICLVFQELCPEDLLDLEPCLSEESWVVVPFEHEGPPTFRVLTGQSLEVKPSNWLQEWPSHRRPSKAAQVYAHLLATKTLMSRPVAQKREGVLSFRGVQGPPPADLRVYFVGGPAAGFLERLRLQFDPVHQVDPEDLSKLQEASPLTTHFLGSRYIRGVLPVETAQTIGLLYESPSRDLVSLHDLLRKLARKAGKSVYTLSVGKFTANKLLNFPDIQVFCVLRCPDLPLLNDREHHLTLCTPYEMLVGLQVLEWGAYETCPQRLISQVEHLLRAEDQQLVEFIPNSLGKLRDFEDRQYYGVPLSVALPSEEAPKKCEPGLFGTPQSYEAQA